MTSWNHPRTFRRPGRAAHWVIDDGHQSKISTESNMEASGGRDQWKYPRNRSIGSDLYWTLKIVRMNSRSTIDQHDLYLECVYETASDTRYLSLSFSFTLCFVESQDRFQRICDTIFSIHRQSPRTPDQLGARLYCYMILSRISHMRFQVFPALVTINRQSCSILQKKMGTIILFLSVGS